MINTFITCPACPTTWELPDLPTDLECLDLPVQSEISRIYLVPIDAAGVPIAGANPFTNWSTTPTVTAGAIDNGDPLKAHVIPIIGNMDAPEKVQVIQPGFKQRTIKRTYTVNGEVTSLGLAAYNAMLQLQCNRTDKFNVFFSDGTYVYGDTAGNGISLKDIDVDIIHNRGEDGYLTANIIARFEALGNPIAKLNPYA